MSFVRKCRLCTNVVLFMKRRFGLQAIFLAITFLILNRFGWVLYQSKALDLRIILANRIDLIRAFYKKLHLGKCTKSWALIVIDHNFRLDDLIKSILLDKIILTFRAFDCYKNYLNRLRIKKDMAQKLHSNKDQKSRFRALTQM